MGSRRERERREGEIKEGREEEGKQISKQFICRPNIAQHWGSKTREMELGIHTQVGMEEIG